MNAPESVVALMWTCVGHSPFHGGRCKAAINLGGFVNARIDRNPKVIIRKLSHSHRQLPFRRLDFFSPHMYRITARLARAGTAQGVR